MTVSADALLIGAIILMLGLAAAWFGNRRVTANGVPLLDWSEMTASLEKLRAQNGELKTEISALRAEVTRWRNKAEEALAAVTVISGQMNTYQQRAEELERKIVTLLTKQNDKLSLAALPDGLRAELSKRLGLDDVRTLCYELGIDYEALGGGEDKDDKIIALLNYVERRQRTGDLLTAIRRVRSDIRL